VKASIRIPLLIALSLSMMLLLLPPSQGQLSSITLNTDQPIYPIWNVGGKVNVTATGLPVNSTYYLWLQRSLDLSTTLTNASLRGGTASFAGVTIFPSDPAGTYLLSLSNSSLHDYALKSVHFGVFGTDMKSYQRTMPVVISGGGFAPNSTVTLSINLPANSSRVEVESSPSGALQYAYNTFPSTMNGTVTISATGPSFDSRQTITVTDTAQLTPAQILFNVNPLVNIQRTDTLVVNATVYYPGGAIITPTNLTLGVNLTLSSVNFTISSIMNFSEFSKTWYYKYFIPFNGTIGDYNFLLAAQDPYGNSGRFEFSTNVALAKLVIYPPKSLKVDQGKLVDVAVFVLYPNGTLLTDKFGGQVSVLANSTTGEGAQYAMFFNSTDGRWHLFYTSPQLGFRFGEVVTFSFQASDEYENSGSAANAYKITVGADATTVALAVIAAAIVPIVLLAWAIATVTRRRRKYKP
jgi:hypothetical protein